jgi:hypothetical protein
MNVTSGLAIKRIIGLEALERTHKKQMVRINNLKEGDANTNFFHRKASTRSREKLNFETSSQHWMGDLTCW